MPKITDLQARPQGKPSIPKDCRTAITGSLAGVTPLLYSLDALCQSLVISRRTGERMLAAGQLPPPDLRIGRMPRWRPETILQWIDSQAAARRGS